MRLTFLVFAILAIPGRTDDLNRARLRDALRSLSLVRRLWRQYERLIKLWLHDVAAMQGVAHCPYEIKVDPAARDKRQAEPCVNDECHRPGGTHHRDRMRKRNQNCGREFWAIRVADA